MIMSQQPISDLLTTTYLANAVVCNNSSDKK